MRLVSVPATPKSLTKKLGKDKFVELCTLLLDDSALTSGNVHAVEIAASTYCEWRTLKKLANKSPDDMKLFRATAKSRNDYIAILTGLGLVKPKPKTQAKKTKTPLRVVGDEPTAPKPRPKLLIVKLPDDRPSATG